MAYRAGVAVLDRMIQNDQDVERSKRDQDTLERRARSADLALLATGELDIVLAQPADELPGLLYTRCAEFAKQRKLDEASQAADHLRDLKPATGTQKFLAASGYGLCAVHLAADDEPLSDEDAARRQAFLDQSLACLQEAVDAGYDDLDELREDDDLVLTRQLAGYPEIEVRLLTAQRSRLDKQLADQPDDLAVRRRAAYAAEQLGLIRQTQQDWPAARTLFQQAVEHATRVVTANQAAGEEPGWNLGTTHSYLARVALAQQNLTQAVADYEAGLKAEPDSLSCIGRLENGRSNWPRGPANSPTGRTPTTSTRWPRHSLKPDSSTRRSNASNRPWRFRTRSTRKNENVSKRGCGCTNPESRITCRRRCQITRRRWRLSEKGADPVLPLLLSKPSRSNW